MLIAYILVKKTKSFLSNNKLFKTKKSAKQNVKKKEIYFF